MIISARNILADSAQYTYLTNPEVAGTAAVRVTNTAGMTNQWAVQFGNTGEEYTEIKIGTIAAAGSLTTAALSFAHPANTPVYFLKYDQLVFERSTSGTSGVAAPMTSGTVSITPDSVTTNFEDTSGLSTYAYKTYFRSSALTVNSTESAWITPAGFTFYSLGALRQRVKDKLWVSNYFTDSQIDNWTNEFLEMMNNAAVAVNQDYSLGTVGVGFSATTELGTITTALFKSPRRVWVSYNGADNFEAKKMWVNDFLPNQQFSSVSPSFYMVGDNVIGIKPANGGGTALITYYQNSTQLVSDDDNLPFPMRGYTQAFVDYALAQALFKDSKVQESAQVMQTAVLPALGRFRSEIAPRSQTGNQYVGIVSNVTGEDWSY